MNNTQTTNKLSQNKSTLKTIQKLGEQDGIILVWIIFVTFFVSIFLLTVLQIGIAHYNKIKLNNDALMLSIFGAQSAHQPSEETINRMAALARTIKGFENIQNIEGTQRFGNQTITLVHNSDLVSGNSASATISHTYGPADHLLSHLGTTVVTGYALSKPDSPLISLAVDMSASLMGTPSGADNVAPKNIVLNALGMSLDATGALQINSPDPLANGINTPSVEVRQSLIPGAFNGMRMMRPWQSTTQNYPDMSSLPIPPGVDPSCEATPERPCASGNYYDLYHTSMASYFVSDLSLQYKYAATTMLSVVSMMSPYLQIMTFGGKQPQGLINLATMCIGTPAQGGLPYPVSNGVNEIWSYDQEKVVLNSFDNGAGACDLSVTYPFDYNTPANIFIDDMPMGPTRLAQFFVPLTMWYKLWKYADIKDEAGNILIPKDTLTHVLTPVMPAAVQTTSTLSWTPPSDSFQYYPGTALNFDIFNKLGITYGPVPLTVNRGAFPHPINGGLDSIATQLASSSPPPLSTINGFMPPSNTLLYEFNPTTGKPKFNQPTAVNCIIPKDPNKPNVCNNNASDWRWCNPDGILLCINTTTWEVYPSNCNFGDGLCGPTSPLYLSEHYTGASSGAGSLAAANTHGVFRGQVSFPSTPYPSTVGASPFYALMFHELSYGTWTNEAVKLANAKRNKIRLSKSDKKHIMIILTDGFPEAVQDNQYWWVDGDTGNFVPAPTKTDSDIWILTDLADQVNQFDGQIVTWYLNQGGTPPSGFVSLMNDPTNDRRMINSNITASGGTVGVSNPTQFLADMTIVAALAQPQVEVVE